ncbi:MAG: site-specific integrase [Verrucomicrobia bacterium]|nr:site-specific integrase [Verrucomicrobiota bacterium]
MKKPGFPMLFKRGHTVVKVYKTPSNGCNQYTVVHYLGEKRHRKTFANLGLATTEAETIATKLSQGELNVLSLRNEDRLAYVRAVEALKPTGVPLEMAALQFAEAVKILDGTSLLEAARHFAKQQPNKLPRKMVAEVVRELLQAKAADGLSHVYLKDLRSRLGRFQEAFTMPIGMITRGEIEGFLRNLKSEGKSKPPKGKALSGKSRNNYRGAIGTLIYFAESRGYLVKGAVDIEGLAVAKENRGDIEIFRPEELARVLATTAPGLIPFLTIGAFAGLRHAEIQRLDWSEVQVDDGFIEVKASKAKTASRRLVPIHDNLRSWLLPHQKPHGPVCPYTSMSKQLLRLAASVDEVWQGEAAPGKFEWKHNALRHSFISYRVAETQNVAQVALEAGNSPRVVFSNYRELVRPADAKNWFSIEPTVDGKVLMLPQAEAKVGAA